MCRWMAYSGGPLPLEALLYRPRHSLIDQSMSAKSRETPTNGDGFGIGWYGNRPLPGLYRSIRPAWNDFNLRDLASQIDSPLFLAHVRATSQATVQETNCHPFRHGRWLFVHNGEVFEIEKIRRELLLAVAPELFPELLGTTDSELLFFLALTFGLERDPLGALQRMAGFVEEIGRRAGIEEALWMTLGLSDGESLWGVRYASDGEAPTLYHSKDLGSLLELNPQLAELDASTRVLVSEPIGSLVDAWVAVPQGAAVTIRRGEVEHSRFEPAAPRR